MGDRSQELSVDQGLLISFYQQHDFLSLYIYIYMYLSIYLSLSLSLCIKAGGRPNALYDVTFMGSGENDPINPHRQALEFYK